MNTEITDKEAKSGWVLYDGDCPICTSTVRRWKDALARRGFACLPLQTDWVRGRLNLPEKELMREMRVLDDRGNVVGGTAALLMLARHFWWAFPLVWLAKVPVIFRLMDAAYRWGAARRYCANATCKVSRPRRLWLMLLLPLPVIVLAWNLAPWIFMWVMAGSLWVALKLFTFLDVPKRPFFRSLAYLLLWPGMDAREFFGNANLPRRGSLSAVVNIVAGFVFSYLGARLAYPVSPLLAGWISMIGMVLVLHFGTFKLLAVVWAATPIMDKPLRSRSLSEFWGRRWNTGFSIPARRYLMEPTARRFGTVAGLLTVFLVSGLVHELVISLPAKAGYGLPTAYFLVQGVALMIERRFGASRLWTWICVALPAFILFHPPFVHRVIIPFLNVIGAL